MNPNIIAPSILCLTAILMISGLFYVFYKEGKAWDAKKKKKDEVFTTLEIYLEKAKEEKDIKRLVNLYAALMVFRKQNVENFDTGNDSFYLVVSFYLTGKVEGINIGTESKGEKKC